MDNQETPKKDSGIGPIIGSIIIIILIVLGGLYFWSYSITKQKINSPTTEKTAEQINATEIDETVQ